MNNGDKTAMPVGSANMEMVSVNNDLAGLTKREYFAAMAMQAIVGCEPYLRAHKGPGETVDASALAECAVRQADALLQALETDDVQG